MTPNQKLVIYVNKYQSWFRDIFVQPTVNNKYISPEELLKMQTQFCQVHVAFDTSG